jgi:hypothetical protein
MTTNLLAPGRCIEPGCATPVPPWWRSYCNEHYLLRSAPCARPGCKSGPGLRPGRTLDASGLCYAHRR